MVIWLRKNLNKHDIFRVTSGIVFLGESFSIFNLIPNIQFLNLVKNTYNVTECCNVSEFNDFIFR